MHEKVTIFHGFFDRNDSFFKKEKVQIQIYIFVVVYGST